jgi:lysophospholipid acyltransferase (LPLAT)-like uncharacterized protein
LGTFVAIPLMVKVFA